MMGSKLEASYHKLSTQTSIDSDTGEEQGFAIGSNPQRYPRRWRAQQRMWIVIAAISIAFNFIFVAVISSREIYPTRWMSPTLQGRLYSPAQHVLRRVDRVFDSSFPGGLTPYQGPPNETNNKLWQDLYNVVGISRISTEEARPMVNHTLPIPGDHGHYMVSLAVFHQLHCLNLLRQVVYGREVDWSNQDELWAVEHLDHCVDIIRQNLQCNADITPITFIWSEDRKRALEEARVIHTCADFDAIHAWGAQHEMKVQFDFFARVSDDPLGWGAGV